MHACKCVRRDTDGSFRGRLAAETGTPGPDSRPGSRESMAALRPTPSIRRGDDSGEQAAGGGLRSQMRDGKREGHSCFASIHWEGRRA